MNTPIEVTTWHLIVLAIFFVLLVFVSAFLLTHIFAWVFNWLSGHNPEESESEDEHCDL
mgnify:CR=1 FL=1